MRAAGMAPLSERIARPIAKRCSCRVDGAGVKFIANTAAVRPLRSTHPTHHHTALRPVPALPALAERV